ncbi:hypothetical protein ABH922_002808 [Rhodococcus sp. 27YEA15]|uniref:hypothetical protein n=1 Tax=Rhodococcus sp. 27YEA15 TaxID=3156259 RepID=UPI003C7CC7ED
MGSIGGVVVVMIEGKLRVSAAELAQFAAPAVGGIAPIAPHLWIIEMSTGATQVIRSGDYESLPAGWVLLMTGPDPDWIAQWDGDWQRACDEQINPILSEHDDESEEP